MVALAERVERATGPDRELADTVLLRCGYQKEWSSVCGSYEFEWVLPGRHRFHRFPSSADPMTSLDVAVTLVPENCGFQVKRYPKWTNEADAIVWGESDRDPTFSADAANPAQALTAAALRAQAKEATDAE